MVGAGVLGLPYTFVYLGWTGGMLVMLLSLLISWYTFAGGYAAKEVSMQLDVVDSTYSRLLSQQHDLKQHSRLSVTARSMSRCFKHQHSKAWW